MSRLKLSKKRVTGLKRAREELALKNSIHFRKKKQTKQQQKSTGWKWFDELSHKILACEGKATISTLEDEAKHRARTEPPLRSETLTVQGEKHLVAWFPVSFVC